MLAPSGEERTLGAAAQVERATLDGAAAALTVARTRGVAVPLSCLGLISLRAARERMCIRAPRGTFIATPRSYNHLKLTVKYGKS